MHEEERAAESSRRLKVGVLAYPSQKWMGGVSYVQNLLRGLAFANEDFELKLFSISQDHPLLSDPALADLKFDILPHVDQRLGWMKYRTALEQLAQFRRAHLDVVHNYVLPLPRWLQIPTVSWLPDFQYLERPDYFSDREIRKRNSQAKSAARFSKRVILSSESARQDFLKIFPQFSQKTRVIRFPSLITEKDMESKVDPLAKFDIDVPFFLVANQFWKHKNHLIILEAVASLKELTDRRFQIVFTGPVHDYRNPMFFNEFLLRLNDLSVRKYCNILGQVARSELLQLMCRSVCVIQPSLFEGWNTVVEECRTLNVPVILSNIAVHQEQAEAEGLEAAFFDPSSPEDLAQLMLKVLEGGLFPADQSKRGRLNISSVQQRARHYAEQLVKVWKEAATAA